MPDLTPIFDLFTQLPEGTGKVALMLGLAVGLGALITLKAGGRGLNTSDYFIWWD